MDEIKFSDDELQALKELQKDYLTTQNQFGQIKITRMNLGNQLDELTGIEGETEQKFQELQKREKELVDELTKKYGQGPLDPSTGLFTPVESPKE